MTERIAYIILASVLAWGWGNYQYNKGWNDCHDRLMNLLEKLQNESVKIVEK